MNDETEDTGKEKVVDETINRFKTQKMGDGSIRVRNGGRVVTAETFWKALKHMAESKQKHLDELSPHLRQYRRTSIYQTALFDEDTLPDYDYKAFPDLEVMKKLNQNVVDEIDLGKETIVVAIKAPNEVYLKEIE